MTTLRTARTIATSVVGVTAVWLAAHVATPYGAEAQEDPDLYGKTAQVHFQNLESQPIGETVLRETPHGILVTVALRDLPPGEHGFHVHETGTCVPPFESAGDHFNPTGKQHGYAAEQGPHVGDLPNLMVPESGKVDIQVFMPGATLSETGDTTLLDADGSALVIHSGPDDHRTNPAGDSGQRIACGIVERPGAASHSAEKPKTAERSGEDANRPDTP